MNPSELKPIARLPILVGAFACACLLGAACGFFASGMAGPGTGNQPVMGPSDSAAVGAAPMALGAIISLLIHAPAYARTVARLGTGMLVSSSARLLLGLALGLVIYFKMNPEPSAFFASLLASGLGTLVAESIWAVRALKSVQTKTNDPAGAR